MMNDSLCIIFCHKFDGCVMIPYRGFVSFIFHFALKVYNCPRLGCYFSYNLPISYVGHCLSEECLLYSSGEL
jgi:hypothetical protein